jgi:hypothetical protein
MSGQNPVGNKSPDEAHKAMNINIMKELEYPLVAVTCNNKKAV